MKRPFAAIRRNFGLHRFFPNHVSAILILPVLLFGGQAFASMLMTPGISGSVSFNFQPPPVLSFTSFGSYSVAGPGGLVESSVFGNPSPSFSADLFITNGFTGRGGGILIYEMQVAGPAGDVDIQVQTSGSASGTSIVGDRFAGFDLKAFWVLEDVNLGLAQVFTEGIQSGFLQGSFSQSFNHVVALTLTANHLYRVTLIADAFAAAGSSGTPAAASVLIDPIFSLGPGVGPGFTILLSDGIGNAAAGVPEPGTLLLSIAGALGLLLWRRRT